MADTTTLNESTRTPIDGTEAVRLATTGANWKVTLSAIATYTLGNAFVQFGGPTTSAKTFTLPDASATILTTNAVVTVAQGGSGAATFTAHGVLIGEGTSAFAALAVGATGTLLAGATGADPAFSATPTLGANGGTGGALTFNGSTSGSVALQVAAAAGTGTVFQLPATNGTNGWVLQTNGSGVTSWVAAAGGSPGGSSGQIQYNNSSSFGGTNLWVTDANTIEKYNSTTAQAFNVYNTRTDASNYERALFGWSSNVLVIGADALGSGTKREAKLQSNKIVDFFATGTGNTEFRVASQVAQGPASASVSGAIVSRDAQIAWTGGGGNATATTDIGLTRAAAKVLAVNDTSVGGGSAVLTGCYIQWGGLARVSSDVTFTGTTTLATVTGLSVNVAAGRTYAFDAYLSFTDAAAGGIQAAISGTATATAIEYDGWIIDSGANGIKGNAQAAALATAVASATTTGTAGVVQIKGTITVNAAGTLLVQAAQNTSNGTATTIKRGSYFIVYDMP